MRVVSGAVMFIAAVVLGADRSPAEPPRPDTATVDFQRDVRPILSNHCFECHGPDAATRMVDLRLDTREGAFSRRSNGSLIVPGDPEASLLYRRISHPQAALRMPPAHSKRPLNDEQIARLRQWIQQGAAWDQHWSFKAIGRPQPPPVKNPSWVRNPLDRFILARLEAEGLAPAPEADRRTLARRLALDLTGLPPDPGTLAGFLADDSEQGL